MKEKYENVIIEVSMNPALLEALRGLKNSPIVEDAKEVQLVHVANKSDECVLPVGIDRNNSEEVDSYIDETLRDLMAYLKEGGDEKVKWSSTTIHNKDSKLSAVEYLKDVNADLVVTATRGGRDCLFSDSFSCYLIGHSPCDVYVIKQ